MEEITLLKSLTEEETDVIISLPVFILFLIGGADNYIDKREIEWAEFVVKYRSKQYHSPIYQIYLLVSEVFKEKFDSVSIQVMKEKNLKLRNQYIINKIKEANPILKKMDTDLSQEFISSLKTYAKGIAESSGGILGFNAISDEEKKYIELAMLEL